MANEINLLRANARRKLRGLDPLLRWQRFWSCVEKTPTCWLWTIALTADGYGKFSLSSKSVRAHIYAYRNCIGEIPKGLTIDHLCRVRHCVNPLHLEAVTNKENVLRGQGITAKQARQTHCKRGHPFDNYCRNKQGHRHCRVCHQEKLEAENGK